MKNICRRLLVDAEIILFLTFFFALFQICAVKWFLVRLWALIVHGHIELDILSLNFDTASMSPIKSRIFCRILDKSSTFWQWRQMREIESTHLASFCAI